MSGRIFGVTLAVGGAMLIGGGIANASTTVGTTSGSTTLACSGNNLDCTVIGRRAAPSDGILTLFRLKHGIAQAGTTVGFKTATSNSGSVTRTTATNFPLPIAAETSAFTPLDGNSKPKGLPISTGERLGVYVSNPLGTSNANLVKFKSDTGGAGWDDAAGDVGPGPMPLAVFSATGDPLVEAVLEPDVDGDGYGDESQDNCPTQANNQTTDPCRPSINILTTPPALTNSSSAAFTWKSSEFGTSFECSVDSGTFTACNDNNGPGNTGGVTLTSLGSGPHTFAVHGVDTVGAGTAATFNWTVDQTPPTASIVGGPTEGSLTNDPAPSFGLQSTEANSTFQCQLLRGATIVDPFASCTTPKAYAGLTDGGYTFSLTATDPAGNTSGAVSRHWTIDLTPPGLTIDMGPVEGSRTKLTSATLTFTSTENPSTFACKLDGGSFGTCSSTSATTGSHTLTGLSDATHTFTVRATDAAGNPTTQSRSWTVDTTPPETSGTKAPRDPSDKSTAHFEYTSTEVGSTFECQLQRGSVVVEAFAPCNPTGKDYSNLTQARYTFSVRATDITGNTDPSPAPFSWTVDLTNPTTKITNVAVNSQHHKAVVSFEGKDPAPASPPVHFKCKLDHKAYVNCASPSTYKHLSKGIHVIKVFAIDHAGNVDTSSAVESFKIG